MTEFIYEGAAKALWDRQFFNERWEDAPDVLKDEFRSEAKASVTAFLADNPLFRRDELERLAAKYDEAGPLVSSAIEALLVRAGGEHE